MSRIIKRGGAFASPLYKIEHGTDIDAYLKRYNPNWYLVYDKKFRIWHIAYVRENVFLPFIRFDTRERPGDMYIMAQVQKSWHDSLRLKGKMGYYIDRAEYERQRRLEREEEDLKYIYKDALKERRIIV